MTTQTVTRHPLSAQRGAASRERIAAARQRRRFITAVSGVLAVLTVVAVMVVVKVTTGAGGPTSGADSGRVADRVLTEVASVPTAAFDAIGVGSATAIPKAIGAPALIA